VDMLDGTSKPYSPARRVKQCAARSRVSNSDRQVKIALTSGGQEKNAKCSEYERKWWRGARSDMDQQAIHIVPVQVDRIGRHVVA